MSDATQSTDQNVGVHGCTVTVMETPITPCPPEVAVEYTFDELKEMYDPHELVWLLVDKLEELYVENNRLREYEWMYTELKK